ADDEFRRVFPTLLAERKQKSSSPSIVCLEIQISDVEVFNISNSGRYYIGKGLVHDIYNRTEIIVGGSGRRICIEKHKGKKHREVFVGDTGEILYSSAFDSCEGSTTSVTLAKQTAQ